MSRFKKRFKKLGYRTSDFFKRKTFSRLKRLPETRQKPEPFAPKPQK